MPLYHYTCAHHHPVIARDGILKPAIAIATRAQRDLLRRNRASRLTSQVIWLTTVPHLVWVNAGSAGLYMNETANLAARARPGRKKERPCDRTQYRWEVIDTETVIEPWNEIRDYWPADIVVALEQSPSAEPHTWWLSRGPLRARYSPHRAAA